MALQEYDDFEIDNDEIPHFTREISDKMSDLKNSFNNENREAVKQKMKDSKDKAAVKMKESKEAAAIKMKESKEAATVKMKAM